MDTSCWQHTDTGGGGGVKTQAVRGLGALRGAALAAVPREVAACRAARVAQTQVVARLRSCQVQAGVADWCGRSGWKRFVRARGRLRAVALDDEVWLASHLRLWRAACWARRWLRGFRERGVRRAEERRMIFVDADCIADGVGEELGGAR